MAEISVAILGLGRIGTSLALALKRYNARAEAHQFIITGYDSTADRVKAVKKQETIDVARYRPEEAVRDQSIVLLAMPYGEVAAAYDFFGSSLKPGAVVFDMTTLKGPAASAAAQRMPDGTHLVSVTPIVNPQYLFDALDDPSRASADLFDGGVMMIMPSVKCAEEAVTLANNLADILGAAPHFFDAAEHDALIPATESLPSLLNIAYFYTLSRAKGWDDIQRLTNPAFGAQSRALFDTHPDDAVRLWLDSGDTLVRHLSSLITTLTQMRDLLAQRDENALAAAADSASKDFQTWINHRYHRDWNKDLLDVETPTFSESIGTLFGNFARLGRSKDKDKDNKRSTK